MQNSLILRLVVIQFAVYAILGLLGFVAWVMAFSNSLSTLEVICGRYLKGHFARWTAKFPSWGILILISATLSFGAAWLLHKSQKKGGYLGIISFLIGFVTNIIVARNIFVHSLIGILIGWTLLAPLIAMWEDLEK